MNYKTKLDNVFSEYIRRRDSNEDGYGRCISCGKIVHWKDADAGHYVNRNHMSLRYDEKNVHLQCRACNRFDDGNILGYTCGLVERYGNRVLQYLEIKKHNTFKMYQSAYEGLTKYYQQKIKEMT